MNTAKPLYYSSAEIEQAQSRIDIMLDEMWDNGTLDQAAIDRYSTMHFHTDL